MIVCLHIHKYSYYCCLCVQIAYKGMIYYCIIKCGHSQILISIMLLVRETLVSQCLQYRLGININVRQYRLVINIYAGF